MSRKRSRLSEPLVEVEETVVADETESGSDLMRAVMSKPSNVGKSSLSKDDRIDGVVIGVFSGLAENGEVLVQYPGIPGGEPVTAMFTGELGDQKAGNEVALSFINGDPLKPIILGPIQRAANPASEKSANQSLTKELDVKIDGETLTLSADREIVLKCGKSSITLTRAGKVIVKGAYVSNHSTGVNRIKGGSVQIN